LTPTQLGTPAAIVTPTATAQGAVQWQSQNPLPQGISLNSIWGSSGSDVFAVGYGGTIMHYDGKSWSTVSGSASESL
jgi:hypothetical protein